jgi:hypothetical protein
VEDGVALGVAGLEQGEVVLGVMAQQVLQIELMAMKWMEEALAQQVSFPQKLPREAVYLPH